MTFYYPYKEIPVLRNKKIVIFGATGNVGFATVKAALIRGYQVTAFVRDRVRLLTIRPKVIVVGDVLNKDHVDKAVANQDQVIIVLGTKNDLSPTTLMSEGTKNILDAMKKHGVKRVSCCLSSFLFWDRDKIPKPYIPVTEDHERMLNLLKASDREWIAVLPPRITEDNARLDFEIKNDVPHGKVISKYDLAAVLVTILDKDEHVRHCVGIGYPQIEDTPKQESKKEDSPKTDSQKEELPKQDSQKEDPPKQDS